MRISAWSADVCSSDLKAFKAAKRAEKVRSTRPKRQAKLGDSEWIAGRNSVVEALRAHMPVTTVYVAEGAERDGRLREVFRVAAEQGISLLEEIGKASGRERGGQSG